MSSVFFFSDKTKLRETDASHFQQIQLNDNLLVHKLLKKQNEHEQAMKSYRVKCFKKLTSYSMSS